MAGWSVGDIPDQSGRVAIVTGSNTGIGFEVARQLARRGAHVIVAARSAEKGSAAVARLRAELGDVDVEFLELDLASFRSIRAFADAFCLRGLPLHLLVNNAGCGFVPRSKTEDGFETVVGVNHVGTFLLTTLLLDVLRRSAPARVVTMSSFLGVSAREDMDRLRGDDDAARYDPHERYSSSKLYNMMFAHELERRLADTGVRSFVCQPGLVKTDMVNKMDGGFGWTKFVRTASTMFGQSAERGATSALYCATSPEAEARGTRYLYGPYAPVGNFRNTRAQRVDHHPDLSPSKTRDLWERTTQLIDAA